MSQESVTEFFLAVSSDEALQEKLEATTDPENFVNIAQESGYSFTTEDLMAVISSQNEGNLSDEALDTVVGGKVELDKSSQLKLKNNWRHFDCFCAWCPGSEKFKKFDVQESSW
jgi:predicted ribosomally synthesized peptide with nif11-like leader